MNETSRPVSVGKPWGALRLLGLALLLTLPGGRAAAQAKPQPKTDFPAEALMVPMDQLGPQPRPVDLRPYAHVLRVGAGEKHQTVAGALASVMDASPGKRYAILVAAGTYREVRLVMKPYVDLYGGFAAGGWKDRNVYEHATTLDAQKKGPVVLGADHARLDGFVITGGEQKAHGSGIVCDGVSPTIVNNIIVGNNTLRPQIMEGLGKQVG